MGKTSVTSRLNLPGRVGWLAMESPGFLTLLYVSTTLPGQLGLDLGALPWQNKVLAGLFVIHYAYRAVLFPLLAPSMSPVHAAVAAMAVVFQLANATCLGAWLGGYGPTMDAEWGSTARFVAGIFVFYLGLAGNFFHDEELREIRRREKARRERVARKKNAGGGGSATAAAVDKHYQIPEGGLFRYLLYPHYLCEWVEWTGFWLACGPGCAPAMMFVVNEIVVMLPRAVRGRRWYEQTFGADKVRRKWTVVPGVL
jgi:3-oxo-5-alpha-steroid 4-dehydrogenase 1